MHGLLGVVRYIYKFFCKHICNLVKFMHHFIGFPPNRKLISKYFSHIGNNFLKNIYNVRAKTFRTKTKIGKIS